MDSVRGTSCIAVYTRLLLMNDYVKKSVSTQRFCHGLANHNICSEYASVVRVVTGWLPHFVITLKKRISICIVKFWILALVVLIRYNTLIIYYIIDYVIRVTIHSQI